MSALLQPRSTSTAAGLVHLRGWLASPLRRREALVGYLTILPWLLGFLFFALGPICSARSCPD